MILPTQIMEGSCLDRGNELFSRTHKLFLVAIPVGPSICLCQLRKKSQRESCELSFIGGKMRTIAQETAFEKLLPRGRGKGQYICDLGEVGYMQSSTHFCRFPLSQGPDVTMNDFTAFLDIRRCKNWAHKICSWKYITSVGLFCQFFPEHTECFIPDLHPKLFSVGVEGLRLHWFNLYRGRWQLPIFSWHLFSWHLLRLLCPKSANLSPAEPLTNQSGHLPLPRSPFTFWPWTISPSMKVQTGCITQNSALWGGLGLHQLCWFLPFLPRCYNFHLQLFKVFGLALGLRW